MGWCSGAQIAEDVWSLVRKYIPCDQRRTVADKLVDIFESEDADTMYEAEQLWKDAGRIEDEDVVEDEFFDRY